MIVSEAEQFDRKCFLVLNDFVLSSNEWRHVSGLFMISNSLLQNSETDDWDRVIDGMLFQINNIQL